MKKKIQRKKNVCLLRVLAMKVELTFSTPTKNQFSFFGSILKELKKKKKETI